MQVNAEMSTYLAAQLHVQCVRSIVGLPAEKPEHGYGFDRV